MFDEDVVGDAPLSGDAFDLVAVLDTPRMALVSAPGGLARLMRAVEAVCLEEAA